MKFTKMHGCGNDYIYVNGAAERIPADKKPEIVRRLSDRHFGIGGDGVIFINPSDVADFEMEMFNADGTRSEMCGNGIRCVAKYVYDKGLTSSKEIKIVSAGKVKIITVETERKSENTPSGKEALTLKVNMGSPILEPENIPVLVSGERAIDADIEVLGKKYKMTCVSMGNPHAIIFSEGVKDMNLEAVGPYFENHKLFPRRTNTEFVEVVDKNNVNMRVWERGTGETLACGTGACATAVACVLNGKTENKVRVHLLGGDLDIEWDRDADLVYMTGPAETVFEGEVNV
ncbi:MAG: diaminopimelate epimerase [Lachnospiraceae bacterium]|nr:diaminopimelate epimerase [Lachnospiraceae bacterium]